MSKATKVTLTQVTKEVTEKAQDAVRGGGAPCCTIETKPLYVFKKPATS